MGDGTVPETRKQQTIALLEQIQALPDGEEKTALAWRVVLLNQPLAFWLAKNCGGQTHDQDAVSEAQFALHSAALYCDPAKGSSYLTVARWYYMRRISDSHNAAGVHVPANLTQTVLRVSRWCADEEGRTGERPSVEQALQALKLRARPERIRAILTLRSVPPGEALMTQQLTHPRGGEFRFNETDVGETCLATKAVSDEQEACWDGETEYDIQKLRALLAQLGPREREAVLTYGGDSGSLAEVGEIHGTHRSKVNTIRRQVLAWLRCRMRVPEAERLNAEFEPA